MMTTKEALTGDNIMKNHKIEFVTPNKKYSQSYLGAIDEYRINGVDTYEFLDPVKYDIFEYIENSASGINLPENYVSATYFWLVQGDEFIGEVSVRHRLTEPLLRFGGNIGYGIRYSQWNRGFGTMMLSMALGYAKNELRLTEVLITCNDNNFASARIIEKNGGILQDKIANVIDGSERITRRYWIKLLPLRT